MKKINNFKLLNISTKRSLYLKVILIAILLLNTHLSPFSWSQQRLLPPFDPSVVPSTSSSAYFRKLEQLRARLITSRPQNQLHQPPSPLTFPRRNIQASQLDAFPENDFLNSFLQNYIQNEKINFCINEYQLNQKTYTSYLSNFLNINIYESALRSALSFINWLRNQPHISTIIEALSRQQFHETSLTEIQRQENLLLTEVNHILNESDSVDIDCNVDDSIRYQPERLLSSMNDSRYEQFMNHGLTNFFNNIRINNNLTSPPSPLLKSHCISRNIPDDESNSNNTSNQKRYQWTHLQPNYFVRIQSTHHSAPTVEIIHFDNENSFYFLFDLISGHQIELTQSDSPYEEIVESYLHPENQRLRTLSQRPSHEILHENEFNEQEEQRLHLQMRLAFRTEQCSSIESILTNLLETSPISRHTRLAREENNVLYTIHKATHSSIQRDLSARIRSSAQQLVRDVTPNSGILSLLRRPSCSELPRMISENSITKERLHQMAFQIARWYKNRVQSKLRRILTSNIEHIHTWLERAQRECSLIYGPNDQLEKLDCSNSFINQIITRFLANESECEVNTSMVGFLEPNEQYNYVILRCMRLNNIETPNILTYTHVTSPDQINPFLSVCQRISEPWLPDDEQRNDIHYCINQSNLENRRQTRNHTTEQPDELSFRLLVATIKDHILYGHRGIRGLCENQR